MKTLIIIITSLVIVITILLVLFIREFIRQHKNFLALLSSINREIGYINGINEKTTSILNKVIKVDSRFITLNETINDNMSNIETALKATTNSINAIEEKSDTIVKILEQLTKFNENHRRMTEMLDNKLIEAKNNRTDMSLQLNNISDTTRIIRQNVEGSEGTKVRIQKLTNKVIEVSNEVITNNELLKEVRDKIEAKNSLSDSKTKKSSSKDGKGQNKLKTAKIDDNLQEITTTNK